MPVISIPQKSFFIFLLTCLLGIVLLFTACDRKAGDTNSKDNADPELLARQYMADNKFDEAEASFIKAIQVKPDNIWNYRTLARLYLLQKNYTEAETQLKAGLKVKPNDEDTWLLLAKVYIEKGDQANATDQLKSILAKYPKNAKAWYALAGTEPQVADPNWKKVNLLQALKIAPANIVLRFDLAELYAGSNKVDSARYFVESIKKMQPDLTTTAATAYQNAVSLLQGEKGDKAAPAIMRFHELMRTSTAYAKAKDEIDIPQLTDGYPAFTTTLTNAGGTLANFIFTDASEATGLTTDKAPNKTQPIIAVADYDQEGNFYLYSSYQAAGSSVSKRSLLTTKTANFKPCSGVDAMDDQSTDMDATFADYDNNGYQDLFIASTKGMIVYRNNGDGTFTKVKEDIGLHLVTDARKLIFADLDQDGDLDLYVASKSGNSYFRNNGDGTFKEMDNIPGFTKDGQGTLTADIGDMDPDGDLDLVTLRDNESLQLITNNRHSKFQDISASLGLSKYKGKAISLADYNNDGLLDILVARDGECSLLRNTGTTFVVDAASKTMGSALKGITVKDAKFLDFDNDGHQDLLIAGINADLSKSGVILFHNDTTKGFSNVSQLLPRTVMQAEQIRTVDLNADGDEDIFLAGSTGVQLIRNDAGNRNNFMQVQLVGLSYGNGKNNRLGIGAQIELKSGDKITRDVRNVNG